MTGTNINEWFSLTRANFLIMPRVLMEQMPEEWQHKFTKLLDEYGDTYPSLPDFEYDVRLRENGRLAKMPEYLTNYRRPHLETINQFKRDENDQK